ncbi:hypothetical protein WJX75_000533 [Coccomyxa subellipsoidea]|uniref:TRUD domain-containing protein n=1 Tax=Coccomyxa subellipsoidea TaxID=248742 RepID=A0ABR2YNU1_9CHLO
MESSIEGDVGISCYITSTPSLSAILKQRYSDFLVNEIDSNGNVVQLNSTSNETTTSAEKVSGAERAKPPQPIMFEVSSNKDERTAVHHFFKQPGLPKCSTETVPASEEGQNSMRLCYHAQRRKRKREAAGGGGDKGSGGTVRGTGRDEFLPGGPKYCRFLLCKENLDSGHALSLLARTVHCSPSCFGVAGTKDKRAVTVQQVTAFKVAPSRLAAANSRLRGMRVGEFELVDEHLHLGDANGNRFEVTLRDVEAGSLRDVAAAVEAVRDDGFINYFGLQRFGSAGGRTHRIGALLLKGEWKAAVDMIMGRLEGERSENDEARRLFLEEGDISGALKLMQRYLTAERALLEGLRKQGGTNFCQALQQIPRNTRTMYVHAYQSRLWNAAASHRVQTFGAKKAVAGDLVLPSGSTEASPQDEAVEADEQQQQQQQQQPQERGRLAAEAHVVTEEEAAAARYSIDEVVLPLPGCRVEYPRHSTAQVYRDLAAKDGISLDSTPHGVRDFSLTALPGGYRRLLHRPRDLNWRLLRYSDPDAPLASSTLDRLTGVAPPAVNVITPDEEATKSKMTVRDNLRLLILKPKIFLVCATAACGGLLFGYDLGVTGGVTGMPTFLEKFYPNVIHDQQLADSSTYCKFNDHMLTLWTSSMFLAGAVASLIVLLLSNRKLMLGGGLGRRGVMVSGGIAFIIGAALQAGVEGLEWGWRLSLGLALVPAVIFTVGTAFCPNTPNSVLEHDPDNVAKATEVLTRFRPNGHDIQLEVLDIQKNAQETREETFWGSISTLYSRRHWKQASAALLIPFFQQFTGMNAIMFYAPQLYQVLGFGVKASLFNSVINNTVNLVATFGAIVAVDALGRKFLFLGAGSIMFVMQIATGSIAAVSFKNGYIPPQVGAGMLTTICLFVAGFACSWGPLNWLVPSEIHTNQTRTAGMCGTVFVNFIASFIIGQFFNQMLCSMQYGVFLFFAGWLAILTVWVAFCLPETKGIAVETVMDAWATVPNWPWKQKRVSCDLPETNPRITGATNGAATNGDVKE